MFRFATTVRVPEDGTGMYVDIPEDVYEGLGGKGRIYVRGTIAGTPFRHSVLRYAGLLLMTLPKELRQATGVSAGDVVEVLLQRDPERVAR